MTPISIPLYQKNSKQKRASVLTMLQQKPILLMVLCTLAAVNTAKIPSDKNRKETSPADFVRLTIMRLIYGIATRVGLGEQISDALNGAFIPPGSDDDYNDFDLLNLFDRDDDYDDY